MSIQVNFVLNVFEMCGFNFDPFSIQINLAFNNSNVFEIFFYIYIAWQNPISKMFHVLKLFALSTGEFRMFTQTLSPRYIALTFVAASSVKQNFGHRRPCSRCVPSSARPTIQPSWRWTIFACPTRECTGVAWTFAIHRRATWKLTWRWSVSWTRSLCIYMFLWIMRTDDRRVH